MVVNMVCYNLCGNAVESRDGPVFCAKPPASNLYKRVFFHLVFHIRVSRFLNVFEPNRPFPNLYFRDIHLGFPPKMMRLITREVSLYGPLP